MPVVLILLIVLPYYAILSACSIVPILFSQHLDLSSKLHSALSLQSLQGNLKILSKNSDKYSFSKFSSIYATPKKYCLYLVGLPYWFVLLTHLSWTSVVFRMFLITLCKSTIPKSLKASTVEMVLPFFKYCKTSTT